MITKNQRDALISKFLLHGEIDTNALQRLEIQEVICLISIVNHYMENEDNAIENLHEKARIFHALLIESIKNADVLYIAYNKATNYPHIDGKGMAWIFSKETFAKSAEDYYLQQYIMLEMKSIQKGENISAFADLYRIGIEQILVDNGQYVYTIKQEDILPPPDWSNTPQIQIPVMNPKLQFAMIRFFQNLNSNSNYQSKKEYLQTLEEAMIEQILDARYLVPMQLKEKEPSEADGEGYKTIKKGAIMQFASLVNNQDNSAWLPVFSDWQELEKIYDKDMWSANIACYHDLLALSNNNAGFVINAGGLSFQINNKNKKAINETQDESDKTKKAVVEPYVLEKDTRIMLGDPQEYPTELVTAMKQYMRTQKGIKKAYLRLMVKEEEKSYLIIVDFSGDEEAIFKGIADAALPYLNGMCIDLHRADKWGMGFVKNVKPFYKKKLMG